MPRSIRDSEDEDEILLDDRPSQRSTYSAHLAHAEAILQQDFPGFDGPGDERPASTNSSELRRQIQSAERNLAATASLSTPALATATSPALQKDRRRRTTVVGSEPVASPPKSARRTKTTTVKTYGADDAAFAALRDNANAPKTSESARFTEHSGGPNVSSGLPADTIQEDFINHVPNVMFKDTGSTNAFNESSQQRLVEQAMNNTELGTAASGEKAAASAERQESSSFPWSASGDATQSPKNKGSAAQSEHPPQLDIADDTIAVATKQASATPSTTSAVKEYATVPDKPAAQTASSTKTRPPNASPVVKIPRYEPLVEDNEVEAPKSTRGRKRKEQEDDAEEPLNSDDRAIGLPKENYKPRPSRRRATAALEEPIDYSQRPEHTAKKRRKTAEGTLGTADHQTGGEKKATAEQSSSLKASTPAKAKAGSSEEHAKKDHEEPKQSAADALDSSGSPEKGSQQSNGPSKQEPKAAKKSDDAMSMKPPPLPASGTKKSRRSKTTIFEDHVDLNRSQKSPTLSQQQASRQSALVDLTNDAKPNKRHKRRTIVQEDEDDEDELAKDMSDEEQDVVPKKRGRPPKSKPQTKSKEKVLEDSEDDDDELELEEEEEPPKKKRGRPAKAKPDNATSKKNASETVEKTPAEQPSAPSSETVAQSSPSKAALERKDANARAQSNASKDGPDKAAQLQPPSKDLSSPHKIPANPSPTTTHSPIKGSSFANYRVGLSKRSRIPSLLKSFRAPAPPRR